MKAVSILITLMFVALVSFNLAKLDDRLRHVLKQYKVEKLPQPVPANPAKVALGRVLFFDKILSGNKDVSCATCHHPGLRSGDSLALSIGVGGSGLGLWRKMGEGRTRIPRNSPEIFNRGASEWHTMFWDSRVSGTVATGFKTPADEKLPEGFDNVLAVQAMFPVTSREEMRGEIGDKDIFNEQNELALISDAVPQSVWQAIMERLLAIPEYQELFKAAYPDTPKENLGFQHAANAIAAFEIEAFTFTNSPWDRYLAGNNKSISNAAKRGALLFYGDANCVACHSGTLMTDQKHHNIGIPQFGPGKENAIPFDIGRFAETGDKLDRFAFRTPPLRNVALTGPWMHNGAYYRLEDAIAHHFDAAKALRQYDSKQLEPELQETYKGEEQTLERILETLDPLVATPGALEDNELQDLMAFLSTLTDPATLQLNVHIPPKVPSGLPVENMIDRKNKNDYNADGK